MTPTRPGRGHPGTVVAMNSCPKGTSGPRPTAKESHYQLPAGSPTCLGPAGSCTRRALGDSWVGWQHLGPLAFQGSCARLASNCEKLHSGLPRCHDYHITRH